MQHHLESPRGLNIVEHNKNIVVIVFVDFFLFVSVNELKINQ